MTKRRSGRPSSAKRKEAAREFFRAKNQYGIYSESELALQLRRLPASRYLIDGLLQRRSVNILVGDSGIGKSALVYQLALAVATGKPFLGLPVYHGKVILVDYENSLWDAHHILQQQRKYFGLDSIPNTLQLWPMNQAAPGTPRFQLIQQGLHEEVEEVIDPFAPDLLIFDSLRSFNPAMENDNTAAAKQIKQLRAISQGRGTAILLVHHVRKHGLKKSIENAAHLEDSAPLDWLTRSAGSRALINQTDARLAISNRKKAGDTLVLRGHLRTYGEVGPYLIERIWDDSGEPLAYQRFEATPEMLENPDQEAAFEKLPDAFSFTEARLLYGKRHQATLEFLQKLIRLGLARKTARGQYQREKTTPNGGFCPQVDVSSAA